VKKTLKNKMETKMAKSIFKDFDFDEYHSLLDFALKDGSHIVHTADFSGMGGCTFVWKRESPFAKGKMIRVAVSFCSDKDQFCRKIGAMNALNNFYNKEENILLPIGDPDSAVIVHQLRSLFYHII
jgi:hypothetical protein